MKKRLYFITILLSATVLSLSSCLKDSRYVDFSKGPSLVEFNLGGLSYFGQDAITATNPLDTVQFAVSVASVTVPTTATTITLAVDNSIITSYNAANPGVVYLPVPAADFKLSTTTVTIPAGQRAAIVSLVVNKGALDPTLSYMIPVKIASTTGGYTISGNMGIHYYHIIGNDFAGAYDSSFRRWNAADSTSAALNGLSFPLGSSQTVTLVPVSPTELNVYTYYDGGQAIRYDITFTKTAGAASPYSNFHVGFVASDVTAVGPTITIQSAPVFVDPASTTGALLTADLAGPFTKAEAEKLFHFQFIANVTGTGPRYIKDQFVKLP